MEKKFQKDIFYQKNTVFSVTFAFILNPCQDGNVHTYATIKELRKMAFRKNGQNVKQAIGTFLMEKKLEKEHFLAKRLCLFGDLSVQFEPLLGWECAYVHHHLRTGKEGIQHKYSEYTTSNWHTIDFHFESKASK